MVAVHEEGVREEGIIVSVDDLTKVMEVDEVLVVTEVMAVVAEGIRWGLAYGLVQEMVDHNQVDGWVDPIHNQEVDKVNRVKMERHS